MKGAGLYRKSVTGVSKYFPDLSSNPSAYVAPADLFSVDLSPPSRLETTNVEITVVVNPLTQAGIYSL